MPMTEAQHAVSGPRDIPMADSHWSLSDHQRPKNQFIPTEQAFVVAKLDEILMVLKNIEGLLKNR